jgi:RimJ/RimL family protein N-acetyltransferase
MAEVTESLVASGTGVHLTPLSMDNIYTHFRWDNDPELNRLDSELPYEKEGFGEFKRRFEELVTHPSPFGRDFEIHAEDGRLIGVAYVAAISPSNRNCLIGITIGDRAYWGRGYGREALKAVLDYCFNGLHLHRVASETFEYNTSWQKLVEWAGFTKEGVERDYLFRDGEFWDKEIYGLLEDEYRARPDLMVR